ncbi:MAG: sugar phosphate isomerase/epimerase [Lachnospiraceae bacterium]|nr:sugar phosphate isomerase/epimerase [Lachnospiraceae bacterium]
MKQSVITGSMGNLGDRFVFEGYKEERSFREKAEKLARIPGIQGLEISSGGEEADGVMVKKVLEDLNLKCACVNVAIAGRRDLGKGSLSNPDPKLRQKAIDICKHASDYATKLGADVINVWPGQDGFDYAMCTDYGRQYHDFLDGAVEVAKHNPDIKVALEFKPREPRNRSLVDTYGTALLMCAESGVKNLGVSVDVGHVLYANANMAAAVWACAERGKLFHMHTNDCLGYWDDDMILGSVHFIEYLELCYVLRKVKYEGWCSVDIFPNREDAFACARESILYLELFDQMVDRIGMGDIEACIRKGDAAYVSRLIREKLFSA